MYATAVSLALAVLLVLGASASVAVGQIALGLVLLHAIVRAVRDRWRPPRLGIEGIALAFFAWTVVVIPFSEDASRSVGGLDRFYLWTAVWLVAAEARDLRARRVLALAVVLGGAAVAIGGTALWIADGGLLFRQRADVVSNAMTTGALSMIGALVALALATAPGIGRASRAIAALATAATLFGLAATMTRSALLGFGVGTLVIVWTRWRRRRVLAVAGVLTIAALVVFAGERFLPDGLAARLSVDEVTAGRNTIARLDMWKAGLAMVAERPLTGFGDVSLGELSRAYYHGTPERVHGHMHSNLVQIAVIWGLPGLVLYLALVVRQGAVLVRRLRETTAWDRATAAGALAVVVGFFVAGLTEWYFGDAEPMLLASIVFGLGAAPPSARPKPGGTGS